MSKMKTDSLFVIDGHVIDFSNQELGLANDARRVFDVNFEKCLINCAEAVCFSAQDDDLSNVVDINIFELGANVYVKSGRVYEFRSSTEGFVMNLYFGKSCLFGFSTDAKRRLAKERYGAKLEPVSGSSFCYYTDGYESVVSDDLTNRIVRYSATEELDGHFYTKYYEYVEDTEVVVYLLLVDYAPCSVTVFDRELRDVFNFVKS